MDFWNDTTLLFHPIPGLATHDLLLLFMHHVTVDDLIQLHLVSTCPIGVQDDPSAQKVLVSDRLPVPLADGTWAWCPSLGGGWIKAE